jgi:hypothetical protein
VPYKVGCGCLAKRSYCTTWQVGDALNQDGVLQAAELEQAAGGQLLGAALEQGPRLWQPVEEEALQVVVERFPLKDFGWQKRHDEFGASAFLRM